ncbi:MAG: PIG-L family deacetylase [Desulfobacteraceae bacterium]|nr:PIG-L family deacetylase [Desulfobacteraceae bacterium]
MTPDVSGPAARWQPLVLAYLKACELGRRLTEESFLPAAGSGPPALLPTLPAGTPVAVLCSPHPDDEMLTGALALRLRKSGAARVVNLALTLGSALERQVERWRELQAACAVAGFECRRLEAPPGFRLKEGPEGAGWEEAVEGLAAMFAELDPRLVFFPHREDRHPAHVAAHRLAAAALTRLTGGGQRTVLSVETEYWRQMSAPNLLVGLTPEELAWLLAALACHRGEIARNPYHLTLPARMLDNVRRGAELTGRASAGRPDFLFGELYRLSVWRGGDCQTPAIESGWLAPDQDVSWLARAVAV